MLWLKPLVATASLNVTVTIVIVAIPVAPPVIFLHPNTPRFGDHTPPHCQRGERKEERGDPQGLVHTPMIVILKIATKMQQKQSRIADFAPGRNSDMRKHEQRDRHRNLHTDIRHGHADCNTMPPVWGRSSSNVTQIVRFVFPMSNSRPTSSQWIQTEQFD